jgi:bisphosphoglycerate-dependent phosphoglycerate mutase
MSFSHSFRQGDLTGKSKAMIARQFGEVQFKLWRRGYRVKPPALNSFSPEYQEQ